MLLQSKKIVLLNLILISKSNFNFPFVEKLDVLKDIKVLESNKATQNTDIPTKFEDNADIITEFIFTSLNKCTEQCVISLKLKLVNIAPVHKNNKKPKKLKRQFQPCQYFIKYL